MTSRERSETGAWLQFCVISTKSRRGLTLVEIVVVVLLAAMVFGLIGTFLWRNARTSRATDRKLQAISAVHYFAGRLRRDMKGAREFKVEDSGRKLTITDHEDRKRVYQYDPQERTLQLPDLMDPASSSLYEMARFREIRFIADPDGGGLTYVVSAIPFFESKAKLTETEIGWGSAISGRISHSKSVQTLFFPYTNFQGLPP